MIHPDLELEAKPSPVFIFRQIIISTQIHHSRNPFVNMKLSLLTIAATLSATAYTMALPTSLMPDHVVRVGLPCPSLHPCFPYLIHTTSQAVYVYLLTLHTRRLASTTVTGADRAPTAASRGTYALAGAGQGSENALLQDRACSTFTSKGSRVTSCLAYSISHSLAPPWVVNTIFGSQ